MSAIHAIKTTVSASAKFGVGFGLGTVFIATMDDVIYSNFRKNVIMPF